MKIPSQLESRQCGIDDGGDFGDEQASESEISTPPVEVPVPLIQELRPLHAESSSHGVPLGTMGKNVGRILPIQVDSEGQVLLMNLGTS